MGRYVLTTEQQASVCRSYASGLSYSALARRYHCHNSTIANALRRLGVRPRSRGGTAIPGVQRCKSNGYLTIVPAQEDPIGQAMVGANGDVLLHRLVMAHSMGRALARYETVHHIDGDPFNNERANLQLRQGKHGQGSVAQCRLCGGSDIEWVPIAV